MFLNYYYYYCYYYHPSRPQLLLNNSYYYPVYQYNATEDVAAALALEYVVHGVVVAHLENNLAPIVVVQVIKDTSLEIAALVLLVQMMVVPRQQGTAVDLGDIADAADQVMVL